MSGIRWLYVSESAIVYEIPHPKQWVFKPVPELANECVLQVNLYFETNNRRPHKLTNIGFDRLKLDDIGGFALTDDVVNLKVRNFLNYAFMTPEDLSTIEEPWPIPDAPIIPLDNEIAALKDYIKNKYPVLYQDFSYIIQKEIQNKKEIHKENINQIKKAVQIRNKMLKESSRI